MDTIRRRKYFGDLIPKDRLYVLHIKKPILTNKEIWDIIDSGANYIPTLPHRAPRKIIIQVNKIAKELHI